MKVCYASKAMAYSNKQDQRDAWNRWYEKNKKKQIGWVKQRRDARRKWVSEYKAETKCATCPEAHPACLQFHHPDPKKKDGSISNLCHNGWSLEWLKKEIAKCQVLCANCHLKLHDHSAVV